MTDSNPSSPVPAAEGTEPAAVRESKVSRLRAAREQKGVHLGVLASSLKVPVARLQALEEGRFEEFADPVFVRTLALSVCRHLEVDPSQVMAELPLGRDRPLEKIGQGLQTPFRERSGPGHFEWKDFKAPGLVGGAVLGLAVLGAVAWFVFFKPGAQGSGAAAMTPTSSASSAVSAAAAGSSAMAASAAASVETVYAGGPVDASTGVVILSSEDSWVEVIDARGDIVVSKVVQPAESLKISAALPLRVKVGNAKATQIFFNGKAVDFSSNTRDNIARVELN